MGFVSNSKRYEISKQITKYHNLVSVQHKFDLAKNIETQIKQTIIHSVDFYEPLLIILWNTSAGQFSFTDDCCDPCAKLIETDICQIFVNFGHGEFGGVAYFKFYYFGLDVGVAVNKMGHAIKYIL